MKSFYITFIIFFLVLPVSAQTIDEEYISVRNELNAMFENLDKTKVPTGRLLDYAIDLVDFSDYNGTELTDSNIVNLSIYKDILKSIQSSTLSGNSLFGNINDLMNQFTQSSDYVRLSFVGFRYNFIKANAIEDNLINYNETTGQVSDKYINGVWCNPYSEETIVAFVPNTDNINSSSVTYEFSTLYSIYNLSVYEFFFDAADGNGYRSIVPGETIRINYTDYGRKTLKLKMRLTNGKILEAHTIIDVNNTQNDDQLSQGSVLIDSSYVSETTYNGTTVKALRYYYFKPGGTHIDKPFIVVEGFDPWILSPDTKTTKGIHLGFTNHKDFHDNYWKTCSLKNNYDLIYIDWDNTLIDIRANAKLLMKIIEEVNGEKTTYGSTEKNVIMGQSMGGLIARYALGMMELECKDHNTSTYISHDAPHHGANVPLGALYFIQQVLRGAYGLNNTVNIINALSNLPIRATEKNICEVLYSQSVKQMLVNYVNPYGTLDNTTHDIWQQELSYLEYPILTEKLAIANGRQFDWYDILAMNTHLIYANGYAKTSLLTDFLAPLITRFLLPIGPFIFDSAILPGTFYLGSTRLNVTAEVNPLISSNFGGTLAKLDISYTKRFLWTIPLTFTVYSSKYTIPSNTLYYDEYPGSQYTLPTEIPRDMTFAGENKWGEYNLRFMIADKFMFIPTASALDIQCASGLNASHYTKDYFTSPPIPKTDTPFDAYFLYSNATEHIHIDATAFDWINTQLNAKIVGPDTLSTSATYSISGYNGPIQWKSSKTSIATIDNNGKLTAIKNGTVTITAEAYNNGSLFRKTKKVMVGFPDIAITCGFTPGEGHKFTAAVTNDEDLEELNRLIADGVLYYEWSLLCNDDDIVTTVSDSPIFTYMPKEDETVTICVRIVDNNGNKGDCYSKTLNLRNPFSVNYKYVEVDDSGTARFIKENGYNIGVPNEDFAITFRNIAYSPYDNITTLVSKYIKGTRCYLAYPNGNYTAYITGTKSGLQYKWSFPLFDMPVFTTALVDVLNRAGGPEIENGEIIDFNIVICNAEKEQMQRIPLAIIYKP